MNIIKYLYEHPFDINKPTSFVESRSRMLMLLHDIILNMNDENAYDEWIRDDIPDCPSIEDFEEIALDDDFFDEVLEDFIRIFKIYKYAE